jgi:hypothetical protein
VAAHAELVEVGLADDMAAELAELGEDRRFEGGGVVC